jgi:hypothetical protein
MTKTRTVLSRCQEDKYGWKPHKKSWDTVTLAAHVVNLPGWTVEALTKESLDTAPPAAAPFKEEPLTSQKQLLERFHKNVVAARAAIEGASDEEFIKPWSLLAGGKTIFTLPRAGFTAAW